MALGDDNDFRMVGFRQVMRFPPQDVIGGSGSVSGRDFTLPFGGNLQQPSSWPTNDLFIGDNLNQFTTNLNAVNNVLNNFNANTGASSPTVITVVDSNVGPTTYLNIDTLRFSGAGVTVSSPGGFPNIVDLTISGGGGGGGTTLVYGKVTGAARIGTVARWSYTVQPFVAGVASGATVTAYNLLEKGNAAGIAYGIGVGGANNDQITGTSYNVQPVPNDAFVAMENTNDVNSGQNPVGTAEYWFSAPNPITGTC